MADVPIHLHLESRKQVGLEGVPPAKRCLVRLKTAECFSRDNVGSFLDADFPRLSLTFRLEICLIALVLSDTRLMDLEKQFIVGSLFSVAVSWIKITYFDWRDWCHIAFLARAGNEYFFTRRVQTILRLFMLADLVPWEPTPREVKAAHVEDERVSRWLRPSSDHQTKKASAFPWRLMHAMNKQWRVFILVVRYHQQEHDIWQLQTHVCTVYISIVICAQYLEEGRAWERAYNLGRR